MLHKRVELIVLFLICLMYIAVCAETDIYVPAFPQMVDFFKTSEEKIQMVLSINFSSVCFSALICGPLSDSFGRRKVLLAGLLVFLLGSIGCCLASQFDALLVCRFVQGAGAAVPMVVGLALFLDKYQLEKASQLVGILNSVITAAMAGAPIVGAWLSHFFGWRSGFVFIAVLVGITTCGCYFFIEETLPTERRKKLDFFQVGRNYLTLLTSFKFVGYSILSILSFVGVIVYISNLSLIFINHIGISETQFGYYQASTMLTYMIFSGLSAKLIAAYGSHFVKKLGLGLVFLGGLSLLLVACFSSKSVLLICLSMAIFAAGGSFTTAVFGMLALDQYPHIKGTAAAMNSAIRQFLAMALVSLSEIFFDGTIVPVASILSLMIGISLGWYFLMIRNESIQVEPSHA